MINLIKTKTLYISVSMGFFKKLLLSNSKVKILINRNIMHINNVHYM
ncbi:MAG: hypothetical protein BAJALOKI3v1_200036 [Promethearchaeota archaeon]|nr:MAG: hypothetical protein BAJALOKI3v1_200036 [Candidatus Lokiarchaeota archaeon]